MNTFSAAFMTFIACFIVVPMLGGIARRLGAYEIVHEATQRVYVLFGNVVGIIEEPGFHCLWKEFGWRGLLVNWLGKCHVLDMRMDQEYVRSQAVNSEEGAPMGIGVWYEMYVSDPVAFLFRNADPRGSLAANVSSATVRCLSNMPLEEMLEDRHTMSQTVRAEVSPKSSEWGYQIGSVYVRKVHFRDAGMIRQIEAKVVNRLRQVTSAIKQAGANQVSVITSTAERDAATEFARAAAMRPAIIGAALHEIGKDPEIADGLFLVLETQQLLASSATVTLIPQGSGALGGLLAAGDAPLALPPARPAPPQAKHTPAT
ncbi:MAG: SPFH domain-containing protein [Armatimonadetes bacterium]|nr:SPFH domain-containing protein [Armatimonadota bacterium]